MLKLKNILKESAEETLGEFAETRLAGAEKIADNAKEKGGDAMLTYHHFHVKLPYYEKAANDKLDLIKAKEEYNVLLEELYKSTRDAIVIDQIAFQKLVGKIEVLGELMIKQQ